MLPIRKEKSLPEVVMRTLFLPGSPLVNPTERNVALINSIFQRKRKENDLLVHVNPYQLRLKIPHGLNFFLAELTH